MARATTDGPTLTGPQTQSQKEGPTISSAVYMNPTQRRTFYRLDYTIHCAHRLQSHCRTAADVPARPTVLQQLKGIYCKPRKLDYSDSVYTQSTVHE